MIQECYKRLLAEPIAFLCSTFPFVSLLVLGSCNTVFYYLAAAYGLFMLIRGKLRFDMFHGKPEFIFAGAVFCIYYISNAASLLIHYQTRSDLYYLAHDLSFLFFPVVALLILPSHQTNVIPRAAKLVLLGNVLAFFYAVYMIRIDPSVRPHAGMSNPVFLAAAVVLFTFLSFTGLHRQRPLNIALSLIGIAAGVGCVLVSESRGPLVAFPLLMLCYFYYLWRETIVMQRLLLAIALILAIFLMPLVNSSGMRERIEAIRQEISVPEEEMVDLSAGARFLYWKYGWEVFKKHPLLGVGTQSMMPMVHAAMPPEVNNRFDKKNIHHKQLHSEYLNTLVAHGLIGLFFLLLVYAAPITTALLSPRNRTYNDRLYLGFLISVSYSCYGIANQTFGRDILNTLFLFSTLLILIDSANARQEEGLQ